MAYHMGPIITFKNIIPSILTHGIDDFSTAEYVPFPKLQGYWNIKRVGNVLDSCNVQRYNLDAIQKRILRIFSILVYSTTLEVCMVNCISGFMNLNIDDRINPLDVNCSKYEESESIFILETAGINTRDIFYKYQYMFKPARLGIIHNLSLMPRCVVPWQPGPVFAENKQRHLSEILCERRLRILSRGCR